MIPIGIVTRNRARMLDTTLRSLSATELPADQTVTIFDDASDCPLTRRYLDSRASIQVVKPWPNSTLWRKSGLGCVQQTPVAIPGIHGLVQVARPVAGPLGVVAGSLAALDRLFAASPQAFGVFLLQDDVLFNADWYGRMQQTAAELTALGILAGMWLNVRHKSAGVVRVHRGSPTAQCWYVTRSAWERLQTGASHLQGLRQSFDSKVGALVRSFGLSVCAIQPAIGQHIGTVSLVRPRWGWQQRGPQGRIDHTARPPYVLADAVRSFLPATEQTLS